MNIGNVFYITNSYNEDSFQLLLENQLCKRKGSALSQKLVEQSISAFLECRDYKVNSNEISRMEVLLEKMGIKYSDYRSYNGIETEKIFHPLDAVKAFNQLASDFLSCQ